mgnify:CR=1 FL=1
MSDRGSFATAFIYCWDCFRRVGKVLRQYIAPGMMVPIYGAQGLGPEPRGIWAGCVKGHYAGEEVNVFEGEINPSCKR